MNVTDLEDLTDDGDTLELEDGRTLRLVIKPDDMDPFDASDFYGKVAPVERSRNNPYHNERNRPDGFDGNAEKLSGANFGPYWWQPHPEGPKRGTPEFEQMRRHIRDLLEFGLCGFVLELLDDEDAYHRPIVTRVASLWGIEPFPDKDYRQEVVRELWDELEAEIG